MRKYLLGMGFGTVLSVIFACAVLPAFGPVFACISGELSQGALEDPMLLISGCLGATIEALIQVIQIELANPPADAGASTVAADDGGASPMPGVSRAAYEAHLNRILVRAQALKASGVK